MNGETLVKLIEEMIDLKLQQRAQANLKANGVVAALMSGSGSTTFALVRNQNAAEQLRENFQAKFGESHWTSLVPL